MKRANLFVLLLAMTVGVVYAAAEAASSPTTTALPQPSTTLICITGLLFFLYVKKSVPCPF